MEPVDAPTPESSRRRRRLQRMFFGIAGLLIVYVMFAYGILPLIWEGYAHRHPTFDDDPRITRTGDDHPGDPLNVALIGSQAEVNALMAAADWYVADRLGLRSDLKIAADTVLARPYDEAPVSKLFLFGRPEDLAFEKPVGNDPRKRNHVRFWKAPEQDSQGRTIWLGSASYDERVGLSHTTGQITHHIAADIDDERDRLFADLEKTGRLEETYTLPHFHTKLEGHNGGGDPWHTDGALYVGVIEPEPATPADAKPADAKPAD
ncbi:LssY C-terminal domain-containing protein [Lignipirellula cremea]|uniref:LssY-like C-terminal domain-containing protein n=1 Tax=Lignipirellula cremea TaxID=2528010 RepID=A0A518DXT4_9BACT|nr:LssY C-terminal domain-containing protein [Lignipirellula cremea]QDU96659.1 hypothetical protein Pla8534_44800 [Lignipirellula cremea]